MPKSISGNGQYMQMLYGPEFQRIRKTESGNSDTIYFNKIYERNTINGTKKNLGSNLLRLLMKEITRTGTVDQEHRINQTATAERNR